MTAAKRLGCGCAAAGSAERATGTLALRRSTYDPACGMAAHAHAEARIVVPLDGALVSRHGSMLLEAAMGHALYRPSRDAHHDEYRERTRCIAIVLDDALADGLGARAFVDAEPGFAHVAARLWDEIDRTDASAPLVLDGLAAHVIGHLRGYVRSLGPTTRWLHGVRQRLHDEFAAPPSLAAIAREVRRDAAYVAAAFKRAYGTTIGEYVRDVRIRHARHLLESSDLPLAEIAAASGFADQSHFTRLFKTRFVVTPSAYRQRLR